MNYLAHAYLSFRHPQVLVGNMISDFIKGKKKYEFEKDIQVGIQLHRDIDTYTDNHIATAKAKEIFRPHYRLYSGAFIDVIYDHFLAKDHERFTSESLNTFSQDVYSTLESYSPVLPQQFLNLLPYMKTQNWLYHYKDKEGIAKSMQGLVRRAAYISDADTAFLLFNENYDALKQCYDDFIIDIEPYAKEQLFILTRV